MFLSRVFYFSVYKAFNYWDDLIPKHFFIFDAIMKGIFQMILLASLFLAIRKPTAFCRHTPHNPVVDPRENVCRVMMSFEVPFGGKVASNGSGGNVEVGSGARGQ